MQILQYTKYSGIFITWLAAKSFTQIIKKYFSEDALAIIIDSPNYYSGIVPMSQGIFQLWREESESDLVIYLRTPLALPLGELAARGADWEGKKPSPARQAAPPPPMGEALSESRFDYLAV